MSAKNRVKISNVNVKCDRNLSQESISKAPYFECFFSDFATDHRYLFLLFLEPRDTRKELSS